MESIEDLSGKVVDRVSHELDTTRLVYDRLRELKPAARIRVLRNIQEYLAEEP